MNKFCIFATTSYKRKEMKRIVFCITLLLASAGIACAQSEVHADSIHIQPEGVKNFDGFLLDMSLMNIDAPQLPRFTLQVPDASKDYNSLFRLNPDAVYSQGLPDRFSTGSYYYGSSHYFGPTGFWGSTSNLQMGSFKLKNGMRINTYGEYDKDGRKVYNPSALPWEKHDFKGAFELKTANGAFGIRLEVERR